MILDPTPMGTGLLVSPVYFPPIVQRVITFVILCLVAGPKSSSNLRFTLKEKMILRLHLYQKE